MSRQAIHSYGSDLCIPAPRYGKIKSSGSDNPSVVSYGGSTRTSLCDSMDLEYSYGYGRKKNKSKAKGASGAASGITMTRPVRKSELCSYSDFRSNKASMDSQTLDISSSSSDSVGADFPQMGIPDLFTIVSVVFSSGDDDLPDMIVAEEYYPRYIDEIRYHRMQSLIR